MPTMRNKTWDKRASPISRISGEGVCCGCEGSYFKVVIYNNVSHDIVCSRCRQVWSPLGQGSGKISHISKALGK